MTVLLYVIGVPLFIVGLFYFLLWLLARRFS